MTKNGDTIEMAGGGGGGGIYDGHRIPEILLPNILGDDCPKQTPITSIKLGWQEGVLMPCLLNIWGVMLFLRLTWVIGQAGIVQGLLLMTVANVVTFLTAWATQRDVTKKS